MDINLHGINQRLRANKHTFCTRFDAHKHCLECINQMRGKKIQMKSNGKKSYTILQRNSINAVKSVSAWCAGRLYYALNIVN